MKRFLRIFVMFIAFAFMFVSLNVNAEELTTDLVSEEPAISENTEQVVNESPEEKNDVPEVGETGDEKEDTNEPTTETVIVNEVHKVAVITNKYDETNKPLAGATLQIIDSEGNVVDEWVSDGTPHETLLPEGEYTLHEVSAPEGYIKAKDQSFTVKVEINEINAGVVHDDNPDVCPHFTGVALFYVESNGVREEVYCINQGWEEPHDIAYDGQVLTEDNILSFVPDADPTMSGKELYDKVLDIIYHRINAEKEFPDLTETEIRMITEYALKNYTSAQYDGGKWARLFVYDETNDNGYVKDPGNGTTLGKLAQHWKTKVPYGHGKKLPKIYADFYNWLIRDEDHHPVDMHLYLYSTGATSEDGPYQNLLSVKWFNPYDENYKVELNCVNLKKDTGRIEIVPPVTGINSNNTSNSYLLIVLLGVLGFSLSLKRRFN